MFNFEIIEMLMKSNQDFRFEGSIMIVSMETLVQIFKISMNPTQSLGIERNV